MIHLSVKSASRTLVILQLWLTGLEPKLRPKAIYATNYGSIIDDAAGNTEPPPQSFER